MAISEEELAERVTFLKVLADKNRLRILGLITEREYTTKELAEALDISESTASHHIGALRRADVIEERREGTSHYFRLRHDHIYALLRELTQKHKPVPMPVPEAFQADEFARKTLEHYFADDRLIALPNTHKKWLVVLRRLAIEFLPGERYPEKQVNAILKRYHPDCATLRRYLVDFGFLARANSVYWRTESEDGE